MLCYCLKYCFVANFAAGGETGDRQQQAYRVHLVLDERKKMKTNVGKNMLNAVVPRKRHAYC